MKKLDPITVQVAVGALRSICEEMGVLLMHAAYSANIKERRDCSTAICDASGELVMQAEHIPVHLGAMPDAVRAVAAHPQQPGVSWILNDPFEGGTHLPDITVVTPIFRTDGSGPIAFAACRAHHADVGGPTPGSMPADSITIADEGVVIPPQPLTDQLIDQLVSQMRRPDERRADLRAALSANEIGTDRTRDLAARLGSTDLTEVFADLASYSERRMRACLRALPNGTRSARDVLEGKDGEIELCVAVSVEDDEIHVDFTGSAGPQTGNLNCPLSVTRSATYFALRVLTDPAILPNAGAWRPIKITAPQHSLLNAESPSAVVAGNVETSSRVADLILRAFGRALGQGTMNNLTLGSDSFVYYETLGGGQGACENADGPSCVHVAMSNTLNTPVEALELEFPLRAVTYARRWGSGGSGKHNGGDGVIRELQALTPMSFSLISERRTVAPAAAAGGNDGSVGTNSLNDQPLPAKVIGELVAGDRLRIETPGGGGFGENPTWT